MSKTSVNAGTKVTFSGTVKTGKGVAGAGIVKIRSGSTVSGRCGRPTQLDSSGNYSFTVKMTTKGTFYFRAIHAGRLVEPDRRTARPSIKLVVK